MSVLDTTIVNVALDTLSHDLGSPLDVDPVGRHRLPARRSPPSSRSRAGPPAGSARAACTSTRSSLFTIGSALCGLAWSTSSLVGFRVLQGVGGGMMMPIGQMILVKAAGPRHLAAS